MHACTPQTTYPIKAQHTQFADLRQVPRPEGIEGITKLNQVCDGLQDHKTGLARERYRSSLPVDINLKLTDHTNYKVYHTHKSLKPTNHTSFICTSTYNG